MNVASKRRWPSRIAGAVVAALTAGLFVWALERGLARPDPYGLRILFAVLLGGVAGLLGKMFLDEVARN